LGARIEGWFKRPKKGGQIKKNKKNLRYVIIEGCEGEAGGVEEFALNSGSLLCKFVFLMSFEKISSQNLVKRGILKRINSLIIMQL